MDDDIDTAGLIRMSPEQPFQAHHRLQHIYSWFLYALIVPKWVFFDDYAAVVRGHIGGAQVKVPKGSDLTVFVGGKLFAYTMALVIPMFFHPVHYVIGFYFLVNAAAGVTLATVFQLAHAIEGTAFPVPEGDQIDTPFSKHQLATTANFAPNSKFVTWYVGGLNFQIEHHLFPKICHAHYPELAPIIKKRAEEAGSPHLTYETLWGAISAHYRHLRKLGRSEAPEGLPA